MKIENNPGQYAFIAVLAMLLYLFYVLASTYFTYLILGAILALAFYPIYLRIEKVVRHPKVASGISVILIIFIIVIPTLLTGILVTKGTFDLISHVEISNLEKIDNYFLKNYNLDLALTERVPESLQNIQTNFISSGIKLAGSIADVMVGLLILFSVIYYGLSEGDTWSRILRKILPVDDDRKDKLVWDIKSVTSSVLYGQVLVSLLMGILGGIAFWIAGVDNPAFWGFIMAVFALLPIVGTGLVWVPAAIIKLLEGNVASGVFILAFGVIVLGGVSYLLPPMIVSGQSKTHPLIILVGIFGGLKVFGFAGFLIGPVVAALCFTLIDFYYEDYLKKKTTHKAIR